MTHKAKDCIERPRKIGARYSNEKIAADEKIESFDLNYDAKRDRWNGYDARDYIHVVERFEKIEKKKEEILKDEALMEIEKGTGDGLEYGDTDTDKLGDEEMTAFGVVNKRVRTTGGGATGSVRNLRIREDTAKYLLNLDTNSAHYDPKTRAMREDPQPNRPDAPFHGDNFERSSGDTQLFKALNVHSVAAAERGQQIHMQATPSQAESLYKEFKQRKDKVEEKISRKILDQYGDASAKDGIDSSLLLGQTESYVEYDRAGRVIKGVEAPKAMSKWEEDVFINNHTCVWGSFWSNGTWGYACCGQMVKNSYCTGLAGKVAFEQAEANMNKNIERKALQDSEELKASNESTKSNVAQNGNGSSSRKKNIPPPWGGDKDESVGLDETKLKEAIRKAAMEEDNTEADDRKRSFNSMHFNTDVTPEEMEAYKLKKSRGIDDPLDIESTKGTDGYDFV